MGSQNEAKDPQSTTIESSEELDSLSHFQQNMPCSKLKNPSQLRQLFPTSVGALGQNPNVNTFLKLFRSDIFLLVFYAMAVSELMKFRPKRPKSSCFR